jgi:type VI secretion system secreted protein Hcp
MAFDGFMWFLKPENGAPPVQGETMDTFFKSIDGQKAFELKSFTLDVENPTSIGSAGGGAGTGKAKLNPFKVTKWTDNCSPSLFATCCCGGHYGSAKIWVRKAGAATGGGASTAGLVYLKFTFNMVFVSNIEWSGDSGDELPGETVTFAYGSMTMEYTPQSSGGGARTANVQTWNQVTNDNSPDVPEGF